MSERPDWVVESFPWTVLRGSELRDGKGVSAVRVLAQCTSDDAFVAVGRLFRGEALNAYAKQGYCMAITTGGPND